MISAMQPQVREQNEFVPQAILKRPPSFFVRRGITFSADTDDIHAYEVASLTLDGTPFALLRHEGTPADETEVLLPDTIPLNQVQPIVQRIVRELNLPLSAICWLRVRSDTPF